MRSLIAFALAFLSAPLMAANIRFDPPNPTSVTPVTAHLLIDSGCAVVVGHDVMRDGNEISIKLLHEGRPCIPELPPYRQDLPIDLGVMSPGVYHVVASPTAPSLPVDGVLAVTEANPSFRIEPNTIDASGGALHLVGPIVFCAFGPSPIICGNVSVKIGGIDAVVTSKGNNELNVQAPGHAPGTVNVVVQGDAGTFTRTAALHYFAADGARDPAFFERVLLPVFFSGPGAFGSEWRTEVAAHNGNEFAITGDGPFNLAARESTVINGTNIPTGVVHFIPRQATSNLDFSLVVRDVSRDATDLGTSTPVVRESEMFTDGFSLVNVPSDSRYRLGLRLYTYDVLQTLISVKITALDGSSASIPAPLTLPAGQHGFVLIGNLLGQAPQMIGKGPLRIDINPFETAARSWGYVTVTNNDTQHVTVIAPE